MATVYESEPNGAFSNANSVNLGDTIVGSFLTGNDEDVYKIYLSANTYVTADYNDAAGTGNSYSSLYLCDINGTTLASDTSNANDASLSYLITTSGYYYVDVYNSSSSAVTGNYSLSITQATVAAPLNTAITSRFTSGDSDMFKVTTTEGTFISLNLDDAVNTASNYTNLHLYDQYGVQVTSNTSNANDCSLTAFVEPGDYYFQAYNNGSIEIRDHSATISQSTNYTPLNQTIAGRFETGQNSDLYKVNAAAGTTLSLSFNDAASTPDNYTNLHLYNQYGVQVAYNTSNANDASLTYTASTAGDYYFQAYNNGSAETENYALTITATGSNVVTGGNGNDNLSSGNVSKILIGGAGTDTALYTGNRNSFDIEDHGNGVYAVTHGAFQDTLSGVERLSFSDGSMSINSAIEVRAHQEEFSRFYSALFGRNPDEAGLQYWVNDLSSPSVGGGGNTIQGAAQAFTQSPEFQGLYGANVSSSDFVNLLYQNILHRPADQAGFDYWSNEINQSGNRGGMIVSFANSTEYEASTATAVHAFLANVAITNYIVA